MLDEDEHIDKSQWVDWSDRDPLIKSERSDIAAIDGERGGVEYRLLRASTVVGVLYEQDKISAEEFSAISKYIAWHSYFSAVWTGEYMPIDLAAVPSDGMTSHLFLLLLQRLNRLDQKLIDFAIQTVATPHIMFVVGQSLKLYHSAFVRLHMLIERLKDAQKAAKEHPMGADPEFLSKHITKLFMAA